MGEAQGAAIGRRVGARVTPDEERRAEAAAVQRQLGNAAPVFIAERIGALALEGDLAGVRRWKEIAARFDALNGAVSVPH